MHDEILKNPFWLLKLPTDATKKEIIARSQELMDLAETEEERDTYRWAKEQLISDNAIRLRYELFEMPNTQYENEKLENFIHQHERNPINSKKLIQETPPLSIEDIDMPKLTRLLLEDLLATSEVNLDDVLQHIPGIYEIESPLEVSDVIFG